MELLLKTASKAVHPRLGVQHPRPAWRFLLPHQSHESALSKATPKRRTTHAQRGAATQDRKAHQQTQRLGARYPTPRRGKLMTATEAAVSHAQAPVFNARRGLCCKLQNL
ncbi:hypothetical protein PIB30_096627 [Stylosanthes scabra]|uniref:Uncharacterized protein n=1 Tax=Stylosanthes scabra TaxID=79078 RepID=A0ABU6QWX0_9FABA|nr:hypothetical protein [Stylosanthes scabra]